MDEQLCGELGGELCCELDLNECINDEPINFPNDPLLNNDRDTPCFISEDDALFCENLPHKAVREERLEQRDDVDQLLDL